jgi:hypothetical protein
MKEPRVKEIIDNYIKGNIKQVDEYLSQPDMVIDPSTWSAQVKKMIDKKEFYSVKILIETTAYKFISKKKLNETKK